MIEGIDLLKEDEAQKSVAIQANRDGPQGFFI
jgi:hypothetical protein